ncbi:MAG: hypothetical protein NTY76_01695 [Candidatus Omnitrophica bacterium]|nr:hypothetical protein [Candidatus Omnitrophota bacterium]
MNWEKSTKKDNNTYEIPETWLLPHYYEVLTILFKIENALRVFVFSVLKNEFEEKWSNLSITSDDSQSGTIESIAKKRISQAKDFGYLGYFVSCPIMYLTTGELIRLITAESHWPHFAKYFLGSKTIMENKLNEIINVRNSIAHFRPIKKGDVDLIKQNTVHALGAIETYLQQLTNCKTIVPTNTPDAWYKELKILGTDNILLSLFFSDNEEWVQIDLKYNCPIIRKKVIEQRYVLYRLLTIISPAVLKKYPLLTSHIIYLSEDVPYFYMKKEYDTDFSKNISIVISKNIIEKKYKVICSQIKELLQTISEETELIKQDNLAKGGIIKAVDVRALHKKTQEEGSWTYYSNEMSCNVQEDSPPEFWGNISFPSHDFISETYKYPWMPIAISEMKIFF